MKYQLIFKMMFGLGYNHDEAYALVTEAKYGCPLALYWIKGLYALSKVRQANVSC